MDNNSPEKRQQPRVSLEVQVRVIPSQAVIKCLDGSLIFRRMGLS